MTTPTKTDEQQKGFIAQILAYINEGSHTKAVQILIEIENKVSFFDVLYQLLERLNSTTYSGNMRTLRLNIGTISSLALARDLELDFILYPVYPSIRPRALAFARALARDLDRVLPYARDIDLARDLAYDIDLVLARDLARDLANDLAHDIDRDIDRTLARPLARARDRARPLDSDLVSIIEDFQLIAQHIENLLNGIEYSHIQKQIQIRYQRRLASALDETLYLIQDEKSPILAVIADVLLHQMKGKAIPITLEGVDRITPDVLSKQIAPFMQAIQGFQKVHAHVSNQEYKEPRIVQIHNAAPKIDILGIGDIILALNEVFSFRMRKDKEKLRALERQKLELEIEQARELLPMEMEAKRVDMMVKLAKAEAELMQIYMIKADEYLRNQYPNLSDEQRRREAPEIAKSMMLAAGTNLRLRIGWQDVPRPPTLPK